MERRVTLSEAFEGRAYSVSIATAFLVGALCAVPYYRPEIKPLCYLMQRVVVVVGVLYLRRIFPGRIAPRFQAPLFVNLFILLMCGAGVGWLVVGSPDNPGVQAHHSGMFERFAGCALMLVFGWFTIRRVRLIADELQPWRR